MEQEKQISSYYKDVVPKLIEKLKTSIDECLKIVGEPIDKDVKEDRLLNVLKARRQASDDAIYYAKEIDRLEAELNGEIAETKEETKTETVTSWTKRKAN